MADTAKHSLMGGKLHVYKRDNSACWQCSTYLNGKNWRTSTKEESLAKAKDFAEDCFLDLHNKKRSGELKNEKTFKKAADFFVREYELITEGQRSKRHVEQQNLRIKNHLLPYLRE